MKTLKWSVILLLLVIAVVGAGTILPSAQAKSAGGKQPIDFSLTGTNGKPVKLSDYRGKVVVIDVWATWCGYCVREVPDLIAWQAQLDKAKTPIQLLGVAMDREHASVDTYVRQAGINYPVLYAGDAALSLFGDIPGIPTKIVVNDKGVIVDKIIGYQEIGTLKQRISKYVPKTPAKETTAK